MKIRMTVFTGSDVGTAGLHQPETCSNGNPAEEHGLSKGMDPVFTAVTQYIHHSS